VFALISQLMDCMMGKSLAGAYQTFNYTSLNRENVQQTYRNSVSQCSLSPLSASISAIIVQ